MSHKIKILMVVGKSGGHIYPALAIAEALKKTLPQPIEISFLHTGSFLENKIFSRDSYSCYQIPIGGLASGQKLQKKIQTLLQLPLVFFKIFLLIRKCSFNIVFGTGGAITGPALLVAKLFFCYTYIWEANATSGIANRYLSFIVHKSFTVFKKVSGLYSKRQVHCGYPLREAIEQAFKKIKKQEEGQKLFKVLVLGGSQGSILLNQILVEAFQDKTWRQNLFIYHQTGFHHYQKIQKQYQAFKNIKAFDFSSEIYNYYMDSDVIVSRAGSGAIFEIAAFKKALVLVPLSFSAGGHQLQNALRLQKEKAADLIQEKDFNVQSFKDKILFLKNNIEYKKNLANSLSRHYKKNGALFIAQHIKQDLKV